MTLVPDRSSTLSMSETDDGTSTACAAAADEVQPFWKLMQVNHTTFFTYRNYQSALALAIPESGMLVPYGGTLQSHLQLT